MHAFSHSRQRGTDPRIPRGRHCMPPLMHGDGQLASMPRKNSKNTVLQTYTVASWLAVPLWGRKPSRVCGGRAADGRGEPDARSRENGAR